MNNLEGLQFGRFKIEKLLGVGGFAAVYKALDPQRQNIVALKLLANGWLKNKEVVKGFIREGEIASHLSHPNVIKIHEVGQLYGRAYHLMEYYESRTLAALLSDAEQREAASLNLCRIFRQVACGLDYLHRSGMIHRDIKPSNILVLPDYQVKLLDFGLVLELLGMELRERSNAGTFKYMAPEQLRSSRLSTETDIYTLGLILKESLEALGAQISDETRIIIDGALHEDPRKRPPLASTLVEEFCNSLPREEHGRIS